MNKWANPKSMSDVEMAFPSKVIGVYLPEMEEIPEEFKKRDPKFSDTFRSWFYGRVGKEKDYALYVKAKEGVDTSKALSQLRAILASFQPKHEHKIAGWCYLASLWFDVLKFLPPEEPDHTGRTVYMEG